MTSGRQDAMTWRDRRAVEHSHPAEIIEEELKKRGWTTTDLARRMPGDPAMTVLALDMYLAVREPGCVLGDYAGAVGEAFGVSREMIQRTWSAATSHRSTSATA